MTKTVKVHYLDGSLEGVRQVDLDSSQINALVTPRIRLQDIKDLPVANQPAMYLLLGENKLYIGQCENLYKRLTDHESQKEEFWNLSLSTFSRDPTGLDKTKVQYLEFLAVKKAKIAKTMDLINIQTPSEKTISKFEVPRLDEIVDDTSFIMRSLGFPDPFAASSNRDSEPMWHVDVKQTQAKGQFHGDNFIILAGSIIPAGCSDVWRQNYPRQHQTRSDILREHQDQGNGTIVIVKNIVFKSPNEAVVFALGRNANAWTSWKNGNDRTMDEIMRQ